jgi:hypothetical protein
MNIIKEISPYLGVIGISIYFIIVHNKRIKQIRLKKKYYKSLAGNKVATTQFFADIYTEKEMKTLGFKQKEINKIIGGAHGIDMAEVVPHYEKYLD